MLYLGTLTFEHPSCVPPQPPEWFCSCRCWRAAHPPHTRVFSLPPPPGAVSCTILTDRSIGSSSQSSLLRQVPHQHHSSPSPVPDGHQDVNFYIIILLHSGSSGQGLQAGEALKDILILCTPQVKGELCMRRQPGSGLCSSSGSISLLINLKKVFVHKSGEHIARLMEMS